MMHVWGVWRLDPREEGAEQLLELYTDRAEAERHALALTHATFAPVQVREHRALARFDGLETTGRSTPGPRA